MAFVKRKNLVLCTSNLIAFNKVRKKHHICYFCRSNLLWINLFILGHIIDNFMKTKKQLCHEIRRNQWYKLKVWNNKIVRQCLQTKNLVRVTTRHYKYVLYLLLFLWSFLLPNIHQWPFLMSSLKWFVI